MKIVLPLVNIFLTFALGISIVCDSFHTVGRIISAKESNTSDNLLFWINVPFSARTSSSAVIVTSAASNSFISSRTRLGEPVTSVINFAVITSSALVFISFRVSFVIVKPLLQCLRLLLILFSCPVTVFKSLSSASSMNCSAALFEAATLFLNSSHFFVTCFFLTATSRIPLTIVSPFWSAVCIKSFNSCWISSKTFCIVV